MLKLFFKKNLLFAHSMHGKICKYVRNIILQHVHSQRINHIYTLLMGSECVQISRDNAARWVHARVCGWGPNEGQARGLNVTELASEQFFQIDL